MDNKLKSKKLFLVWTLVAYSIALLVFTYLFSNSQASDSNVADHSPANNFFEALGRFSQNLRSGLADSISTFFEYAGFLVLFAVSFLIFLHCFVKRLHPVVFFTVPIFQLALTFIIQFLIYNFPGMPESSFYYTFTTAYILATIFLVKMFYADVLNSNYEKTE